MDGIVLLKAAKKGDSEAFFQLFSKHKEKLYRIALSYLKNEQEALEAIQEVTFRSFKNIKKVREPKYFSTWITRIMMNYCIDELKRRKRFIPGETDLLTESITEENDNRIGMESAIQTLEPNLQEVIILKYFQDFTIDQIAEQLDRPVGTIKTWLNRALQLLRKQITREGGYHV